jgi:hypothetical protein
MPKAGGSVNKNVMKSPWLPGFINIVAEDFKKKQDLIIVPARQGHFFQPGKNSLLLKQLAGFPKTPWRDLLVTREWPNR